MQPGDVLTELYKVAKRESLSTAHARDLELSLDAALLAVGRFDFEDAAAIFQNALTVLQAFAPTPTSLRVQARCFTELGNIRRDQGLISGPRGAYALYARAQTIWRDLNEPDKVALTTWYIGVCNEMRKNHEKALHFYNKALDIIREVGDLEILRGRILLRMGTVLTKMQILGAADKTIRKSLDLLEGRIPASDYGYAEQKLAIVHFTNGEIDKSYKIVANTVKLIPKTNKFRLTQTMILMTDLLFTASEKDAGLELASQAESLANEHGFKHQLLALYGVLDKHISTSSTIIAEPSLQYTLTDKIREIISQKFDAITLRELCNDFGVSYDELDGEDVSYKIRSLITRLQILNRLDDLMVYIQNHQSSE